MTNSKNEYGITIKDNEVKKERPFNNFLNLIAKCQDEDIPYLIFDLVDDVYHRTKSESQKEISDLKEEIKHLRKTGIPRCPVCKTNMVNAVDNITKKVSPYLWETQCEHNKNTRLSLG